MNLIVIKVRQLVGRTFTPKSIRKRGGLVGSLARATPPMAQTNEQTNSPHIVSWSTIVSLSTVTSPSCISDTIGLIHRLVDTVTDHYTDVHSLRY